MAAKTSIWRGFCVICTALKKWLVVLIFDRSVACIGKSGGGGPIRAIFNRKAAPIFVTRLWMPRTRLKTSGLQSVVFH